MSSYKNEEWAKWSHKTRVNLLASPGRGELQILKELESQGYRVDRQLPVWKYFIDLALPELMIAVELDDPSKDLDEGYELERSRFLMECGWTLVRLDSYRAMEDPAYLWQGICHARLRDMPPEPPITPTDVETPMPGTCRCGCGRETSPGRSWRQGHHSKKRRRPSTGGSSTPTRSSVTSQPSSSDQTQEQRAAAETQRTLMESFRTPEMRSALDRFRKKVP